VPGITNPEDGGYIFLRNVGNHLQTILCHNIKDHNENLCVRKNLKYHLRNAATVEMDNKIMFFCFVSLRCNSCESYVVSDGRMIVNGELGRKWLEAVVAYSKALWMYLLRLCKTAKKNRAPCVG
jgi:hypothetical protein